LRLVVYSSLSTACHCHCIVFQTMHKILHGIFTDSACDSKRQLVTFLGRGKQQHDAPASWATYLVSASIVMRNSTSFKESCNSVKRAMKTMSSSVGRRWY
jgi:hypothetical protein